VGYLDLGPMYAIDTQTDVRQHHCLMSAPRGRGHNNVSSKSGVASLRITFVHVIKLNFLESILTFIMPCPIGGGSIKR